jgi:hypothetical protein
LIDDTSSRFTAGEATITGRTAAKETILLKLGAMIVDGSSEGLRGDLVMDDILYDHDMGLYSNRSRVRSIKKSETLERERNR